MSLVSIYGAPFNGSSPWQIGISGNKLSWERNSNYKWDVPWEKTLERGRWITLLLHERFAGDGWVEMWIDGSRSSSSPAAPTTRAVAPTERLAMKTMDSEQQRRRQTRRRSCSTARPGMFGRRRSISARSRSAPRGPRSAPEPRSLKAAIARTGMAPPRRSAMIPRMPSRGGPQPRSPSSSRATPRDPETWSGVPAGSSGGFGRGRRGAGRDRRPPPGRRQARRRACGMTWAEAERERPVRRGQRRPGGRATRRRRGSTAW